MASREDFILAGVNNAEFLVGPSVMLLQNATNYAFSGYAANAFPRELGDVVFLTGATVGAAVTANGWTYQGYTDGIRPGRNRQTTDLGADQAFPVEVVHDQWGGEVTATVLQTSLSKMQAYWQGDPQGPQPVGTPASGIAQTYQDFGSSTSIRYQRGAILHPDKNGALWGIVYARLYLTASQSPNFQRNGRVEWQLTGKMLPDDRIAAVHARVVRVFKTADAFLTT